jgi:hypothetical protein
MQSDATRIKKTNSTAKFLRSFDMGYPNQLEPSPIRQAAHELGLNSRKKNSQSKSNSRASLDSGPNRTPATNNKLATTQNINKRTPSNMFAHRLFGRDLVHQIPSNIDEPEGFNRKNSVGSLLKARRSLESLRDNRPSHRLFVTTPNNPNYTQYQEGLDPVDKLLFGERLSLKIMPFSHIQTKDPIAKVGSPKIRTGNKLGKGADADHQGFKSASNLFQKSETVERQGYEVGSEKQVCSILKPSQVMQTPQQPSNPNTRMDGILSSPKRVGLGSVNSPKITHQTAYQRLTNKVTEICKESQLMTEAPSNQTSVWTGSVAKAILGDKAKKHPLQASSSIMLQDNLKGKLVEKTVTLAAEIKQLSKIGANSYMHGPPLTAAAKFAPKTIETRLSKKGFSNSGTITPKSLKKVGKSIESSKDRISSSKQTDNVLVLDIKNTNTKHGSGLFRQNNLAFGMVSQVPSVPKYKSKVFEMKKTAKKHSNHNHALTGHQVVKLSGLSGVQSKLESSGSISHRLGLEAGLADSTVDKRKMISSNKDIAIQAPTMGIINPAFLNIPGSKQGDPLGDQTDKSRSKLSLKSRSDLGLKVTDPVSLQKLREVTSQSPPRGLVTRPYLDHKPTIKSRLEEYAQCQPTATQLLKRSQTELFDQLQAPGIENKPESIVGKPSERSLRSTCTKLQTFIVVSNSLHVDQQSESPLQSAKGIKSLGRISMPKFNQRTDSYSVANSAVMSESQSLKREFKKQLQEDFQDDTSIASKGPILGKILGRGRFGIVRLIVDPNKQNKALVLKCYNKLTLVSANALSSVEVKVFLCRTKSKF